MMSGVLGAVSQFILGAQISEIYHRVVARMFPPPHFSREVYPKFIVLHGVTHAGKSWLVKNHPQLKNFWFLDEEMVKAELDAELREAGIRVGERVYASMVDRIYRSAVAQAVECRVSIVCERPHLRARDRKEVMRLAQDGPHNTIVLQVSAIDRAIRERLSPEKVPLYERQCVIVEPPTTKECPRLVLFVNGVTPVSSLVV